MDVTASAGAKGGREGSRHVEEKEGGREAWTVVPMPRTRCGEARHREAGADGAEERETEAREGQGVLMREARGARCRGASRAACRVHGDGDGQADRGLECSGGRADDGADGRDVAGIARPQATGREPWHRLTAHKEKKEEDVAKKATWRSDAQASTHGGACMGWDLRPGDAWDGAGRAHLWVLFSPPSNHHARATLLSKIS